MAKEAVAYIKLQVPAGKANPSPPIGPALGQRGVNIMGFCKEFNAKTQKLEPGMPIPVTIEVYKDKSFSFTMKTAPVSYFLKKIANLKSGSSTPGSDIVAEIKQSQIEEIAKQKMNDLNAFSLEAAVNTISGSARSMGIKVVEG